MSTGPIQFKKLNLFGNDKITEEGIKALKERYRGSDTVIITGKPAVFPKVPSYHSTTFIASLRSSREKEEREKGEAELKRLVESIVSIHKNEIKPLSG